MRRRVVEGERLKEGARQQREPGGGEPGFEPGEPPRPVGLGEELVEEVAVALVGPLLAEVLEVRGAGVAGLQALATARRLGAIVEGYAVLSATRE